MRKILLLLAMFAVTVTVMFSCMHFVHAQDAGPGGGAAITVPPADVGGLISSLIGAVKEGKWLIVAGVALSLLVMGIKAVFPVLKDDRLGAIVTFATGVIGIVGVGLASGSGLSLSLILGAVAATWTAVGGYSWLKRLIWPDRGATTASSPGS